jgi:hypothetical protein
MAKKHPPYAPEFRRQMVELVRPLAFRRNWRRSSLIRRAPIMRSQLAHHVKVGGLRSRRQPRQLHVLDQRIRNGDILDLFSAGCRSDPLPQPSQKDIQDFDESAA